MKMAFCRLARPGLQLPMPGEQRLFSERGETVNLESAFWAVLLKDGDIVEAEEEPSSASRARSHASPAGAALSDSAPTATRPGPADGPDGPSLAHLAALRPSAEQTASPPPSSTAKPTGRKGS